MPKLAGTCALTGVKGNFVKSHLIPRALSVPRGGGQPFPQIGNGARPVRRLDSWYDPQLVTDAGEKILTSYDTFAITELRRLKLVWRSWGPMQSLSTSDFVVFPQEPFGLRSVVFSDGNRMRRFLLSLLWRAAATTLKEFDEVDLRASDLRKLRSVVRDGINPPLDFFPASLTQLSSLGPQHNMSPLLMMKKGVAVGRYQPRDQPIFRFYFDGLVVHFHIKPTPKYVDGMLPFIVGARESTTVSTVRSEASWEMQNILDSIQDAEHFHPGVINRAGGM